MGTDELENTVGKSLWEVLHKELSKRSTVHLRNGKIICADLLKDNLPNILMYNCFKFDNYFLGKEISELKTTFPNTSDFWKKKTKLSLLCWFLAVNSVPPPPHCEKVNLGYKSKEEKKIILQMCLPIFSKSLE